MGVVREALDGEAESAEADGAGGGGRGSEDGCRLDGGFEVLRGGGEVASVSR